MRGRPLLGLEKSARGEESPSTTEPRWWVTPTVPPNRKIKRRVGTGKVPQKTYRLPKLRLGQVRVKRCGKSAPRWSRGRRQGKPHRVQGQAAAMAWFRPTAAGRPLPEVRRESPSARAGPDKWPSPAPRPPSEAPEQNSAYSASGRAFSGDVGP